MNYNISNELICRLCLMDNSGNVSIFTNTYDCRSGFIGLTQKIMQIANVQMYEGDGLPTLICRVCLNRVEGFFQFKIQVEKSDFILRQQICQYEDNCVAHVPSEKPVEAVKSESLSVLKSSSTVYITDNTWVDSVQSFGPLQNCGTLENPVPINTPQEVTDVLAEDSHQSAFVNFPREEIEEDKSLLDLSQQEAKTLPHPSEITDIYQHNQCDNETSASSVRSVDDQGKVPGGYYIHDNDYFDQTSGLDLKVPASSDNDESDRYDNIGANSENNVSDKPENKTQPSKSQVINYCEECDQHFDETIDLIKHKYLHSKALKCTFCDKSFKQSCQLRSHIRTHTGERPYLCSVCPKTFIDKSALSSHTRTHFTEKTHACSHCDKTFKLKKQLERHQRIHTGHQYHRCEICSKLFTQKSNLVKHLILHSGAKPYSCEFCDQPFAQKDNLNTHILRHHSEQDPVSCDLCGKSFKNKMTLTGHKKKKHTGANNSKQIICEICGKCFQDRGCLNSHKWVHSPGDPVECDICRKTYPHLRAVRVHKRVVHSEVRKHCCDVCGIGFKTSQTLKHHKVVHTGERAFSCEECGRCFGQKTALTTHYRIHNGIEPYSCPRCRVSFKWKQTCDKHIIKCTGKPNHGFMIGSVSDNPAVA